jgi:hypothetical protein
MVRTSPHTTVFYGASCTGVVGSWFLSVVEGGPNDMPRPAYRLSWTFSTSPSVAHPDGDVIVSTPANEKVDIRLANGVLRITGTTAGGAQVRATGALVVGVSQSGTTSVLTLTETGLAAAEKALQISSPFNVDGQPVGVPVRIVHQAPSC